MLPFAIAASALLAIWSTPVAAELIRHDSSWSPDTTLYATAANITIDCQSRHSVLLNGSSPGPTLYLEEGKTTWIRVYNQIPDQNVTVHWHGLSARVAPYSDGSPQASQWPIAPGHFFDYEIHPEVGEAGTYFYHSHVGFQTITAAGPLIVKSCEPELYEYDKDIIMFQQDYYNKTDATIEKGLLANPFVWSGETTAILLNGQSGKAQTDNATDSSCLPHIIEVEPDTTYRLRFIGQQVISLVTLGIEGHDNLTVIEADGSTTKKAYTDHVQVAPGQRFSILFKTKSAEELKRLNRTDFWIQYENRDRPASVSGYGLLRYHTEQSGYYQDNVTAILLPEKKPLTLPKDVTNWLEYTLTPYDTSSNPFPPASSVNRTIVITVQQKVNGTTQWAQNGNIWKESNITYPYLTEIYKRGQSAIPNYEAALANYGWDPKTLAYPAKIGEIIDIVWENNNGPSGGWDIHPFHAHGRHFWDLGSGNGTYDATANNAKLEKLYNESGWTPALRDTTMQYRYAEKGVPHTTAGWRAWRVNVSEPGVWMMHCHIIAHMIMGMQTAWVFGDEADITSRAPQPYVAGYLDFGGSAYGNATYDPLVNHFFG
ncbi:L-ascorbate oxidase [Paraphaeosphaeria sporulosa]|uniref:L-ascorbate oxidase n=1 Tax=Paraphaeosphaeria sporulosa TaxID=1460663 RepID=A0A177C4Y9_9PLEO|nr:L-ascorbate oxidase [Paraphaeosphaeria sporulosa]OAG01952.1 L-ascorbate oxidase [Paraphaeosphaeria sporulosa]